MTASWRAICVPVESPCEDTTCVCARCAGYPQQVDETWWLHAYLEEVDGVWPVVVLKP